MNANYMLLAVFPVVLCVSALVFPAKREKSMCAFLLGFFAAICVLSYVLFERFPEFGIEKEFLWLILANMPIFIAGWICAKIMAKRTGKENNSLMYSPIVLGIGWIAVGCFAWTFKEFFGTPFVWCSAGFFVTMFGIRSRRIRRLQVDEDVVEDSAT